eukprot:771407-Rhodomonas_salina.1
MLMEDVSSCLSVLRSCWESIGALATILQQNKGGKSKAEADVKTILEASIKVLDLLGQSAGVTAVGGVTGQQHLQNAARVLFEDTHVLKSALAFKSWRSPEGMLVSHSATLVSALSTTAVAFSDALLQKHVSPSPTAMADVSDKEKHVARLSELIEKIRNQDLEPMPESAVASSGDEEVTDKEDGEVEEVTAKEGGEVADETVEGKHGAKVAQSPGAGSHGAHAPIDPGQSESQGKGRTKQSEGQGSDNDAAPNPGEAQAEHRAQGQPDWNNTTKFQAWDSALRKLRLGAQERGFAEIHKIWPVLLAGQGSADDLVEQAEPSAKGSLKGLFKLTGSGDLSLWATEVIELLRMKALGRFVFSFVLRYVESCFDKNPLQLPDELEGLKSELQAQRDQLCDKLGGDSSALALETEFLLKDLDFGRRAMELPAFAGEIEQAIPAAPVGIDLLGTSNMAEVGVLQVSGVQQLSSSILGGKLPSDSPPQTPSGSPDPGWTVSLRELQKLDLSACVSLEELPSSVSRLVVLQELPWGSVPSSLMHLTALESLELSGCTSLEELPSWLGQLTRLQRLVLKGCASLTDLPSSIAQLALQYLDLSQCASLTELPVSIGGLTDLQQLGLQGCESLKELPSSMGQLTGLLHLDLSKSPSLNELPSSMGQLTSLQKLDLS